MASPVASAHLPALGDCLDGAKQLVSWKHAFLGIRDELYLEDGGPIHEFLSDPETFNYFSRLDQPIPPESPTAKTAFERLTSAINAPSSANGAYDIKQIKEDALWMSKEAGIDQVTALRLVVLELQQQPQDCILREISAGDTEPGARPFQKSALLRSVVGNRPTEPLASTYNTTAVRHVRLLGLLVVEQSYAIKCREVIAYSHLSEANPGPSWIQELGAKIVNHWLGQPGRPFDGIILQVMEVIERNIEKLRGGYPWQKEVDQHDQSLTALWYEAGCDELVHDLTLLLHLVQSKDGPLSANVVKAWYGLMDKTSFFSQPVNIELVLNSLQTQGVQSLAALISVAVLQPSSSIAALQDLAIEGTTQTPASGSYLRDAECVEFVTSLMLTAGQAMVIPAGPAMLTWAIIIFNLRDMAKHASENRALRASQRTLEAGQSADSDNESLDSFGLRSSRDNRRSSFGSDGGQPPTVLESVWDAAVRAAAAGDESGDKSLGDALLELANDHLSAFVVISQIVTDFCGSHGCLFGGLFDVESRLVLFDALNITVANLPYDVDLIEAMITVLGGSQSAEERKTQYRRYPGVHPINRLWTDQKCRHQFLDMARSRFPWEATTFLALCQCLAPIGGPHDPDNSAPITEYLRTLSTITTILYDTSAHYDLPTDDDQGNIQLSSDVEILPHVLDPRTAESLRVSRRILGPQGPSNPYILPAGTQGQTLNEKKPMIVMWNFAYSSPGFVGVILQIAAELWLGEKAGQLQPMHASIVNASLGLVDSLLQSCSSADATQVLGDFSENLGDSADIIQVVFDIFESLMYRSTFDQVLAELLVTCANLVRQFVRVIPERVWPFMGRSGLLGIDKTDSRLRVVLASNEIPSGRFAFLLSNVQLFEALVEDAVTNCLKRKSPSKAVTRFQANLAQPSGLGISEASEKRILGQFQTLLIDIFESSTNWRFQKILEKTQITTILLRTMDKAIVYYHDIDDDMASGDKLLNFLSSTASQISNSFLVNSQNNAACHALFQLIEEAVQTPLNSFTTPTARAWLDQSTTALKFASRLVRLRIQLEQAQGVLESGLLKLVPTLIKIYALHSEFKLPTIHLLRDLVVAASKIDSPPSILAHLSTDAAKNFVKELKNFGKPYNIPGLGTAIWKLMGAVVSLQQRWFSIVLLTGSTPRDALKAKHDDRSTKPIGSLLSQAIDEVSTLTSLDPDYAVGLLEFLAQASDYWPWVADRIRKDKKTWDTMLQFIADLKIQRKGSVPVHTARQLEIAAHILGIAAVLVHQSAGNGDEDAAKSLVEKFTYLFENGVSSPEYNRTLHVRLESNFAERYAKTGCHLTNFKRSAKAETRLGDNFYYDVAFASKLLSYDEAWNKAQGGGFAGDLHLANRNLSLVEAQIRLFQSWKSLCTEMTSVLIDDSSFREQMLSVAGDCIEENLENILPLAVFERLSLSRAELAYTILQFVIPRTKRSEKTERMLFQAWDLIREPASELSLGLTGDSADYHRTGLRILYLSLQPHVQGPALHVSRSQFSVRVEKPIGVDITMLEIVRTVVARGFQSLVTLLHDDAGKVVPADFALIQAMLHTILQSPEMERHHEGLLNIFSDARTPMYASTLFSWADRILVDGDPIYGEISINMLLELSTIRPLAEAIVTSGALALVATSNLARAYQNGAGQFDQPMRLYGIWTKGILPLAINLLAAIGPLIAADTAAFINQFSGQLDKASTCMDSSRSRLNGQGAGLMTLTMAGEANSLALMSSSLLAFKDAGASVGILAAGVPDLAWNRLQVKRDIEDRLSRRSALRDSIVPTDEREEHWLRQKAPDAAHKAENLLEHRIVELLTATLEMLGPVEV